MERNQFYYTRKEVEKSKDEFDSSMKVVDYLDSFDISLVTRTLEMADGRRMVLLNDFHEEMIEKPVFNKRKEIINYEKRRETVHSEIVLEKEDAERFIKLTSIEE